MVSCRVVALLALSAFVCGTEAASVTTTRRVRSKGLGRPLGNRKLDDPNSGKGKPKGKKGDDSSDDDKEDEENGSTLDPTDVDPSPTDVPTSAPVENVQPTPEPLESTPAPQLAPDDTDSSVPVPTPTAPASAPAPAPAPSSPDFLSPTEIAADVARSRRLFPFTLSVNGEFSIDDVDRVIESYLFGRLSESFSNLEWVMLTVSEGEVARRILREGAYDMSGVAIFLDSENLPTEVEVQRAQLDALGDFRLMIDFVNSQGYNWDIEKVEADGIEITEDKIKIGDVEVDNDFGNDTNGSQGDRGTPTESSSDKTNLALILSLLAILILIGILACILRRKVKQRVAQKTFDDGLEGKDTLKGLVRSMPDEHQQPSIAVSSMATGAVGSTNAQSGEEYEAKASSVLDWGRVFALSQTTPLSETVEETFEPKTIEPPKDYKSHQIVVLSPAAQGGDPATGNDGDSYGYNSEDERMDDDLLASPRALGGGGAEYDQGKDLTIDLDDFDQGHPRANNDNF